ncbi:hypothetical protein [Paraburkholderia franconis]|nr:hypothetical protein [Paraburkholderia franconis]
MHIIPSALSGGASVSCSAERKLGDHVSYQAMHAHFSHEIEHRIGY